MKGITFSQYNKEIFWKRLEIYKQALETGENLIAASLAIHQALGDVPKSYGKYVREVFRNTKRIEL